MLSKGILARIWTPNKNTLIFDNYEFDYGDNVIVYGFNPKNYTINVFNKNKNEFGKIDVKYIWNPTKLMKKERKDKYDYLSNFYSRKEVEKYCKKHCTCI